MTTAALNQIPFQNFLRIEWFVYFFSWTQNYHNKRKRSRRWRNKNICIHLTLKPKIYMHSRKTEEKWVAKNGFWPKKKKKMKTNERTDFLAMQIARNSCFCIFCEAEKSNENWRRKFIWLPTWANISNIIGFEKARTYFGRMLMYSAGASEAGFIHIDIFFSPFILCW